ncbi:hypothetical protein F4703DRAFT_1917563 [Phycomyces blakesleeanus]
MEEAAKGTEAEADIVVGAITVRSSPEASATLSSISNESLFPLMTMPMFESMVLRLSSIASVINIQKKLDFLDTCVLLPSDASPSQCPSGLAKAILPKLLSTIKYSYEYDEPLSHEHITNQELSFHTSVIDMTILASPMYSLGLQINPFALDWRSVWKQTVQEEVSKIG